MPLVKSNSNSRRRAGKGGLKNRKPGSERTFGHMPWNRGRPCGSLMPGSHSDPGFRGLHVPRLQWRAQPKLRLALFDKFFASRPLASHAKASRCFATKASTVSGACPLIFSTRSFVPANTPFVWSMATSPRCCTRNPLPGLPEIRSASG